LTGSSLPDPGESLFEGLFQAAPFGYVITDHNDVIVRTNATFLAWTHFPEDQVLGRPFRDLLTAGAQLLYETRHLPVLRLQGYANEVLLQLATAQGTVLPILVNASAVDRFGEPREVRIGVLDASGRVSYERELLATQRSAESMAARVTVLQNASTAFASSISEAEIGATLSTIVADALVASAACVALVGASGDLEVIAGTDPLSGLIREDSRLLGATVLDFEKPVTVSVTGQGQERFPGVVSALREARLQTVAVFPIMDDGIPIGVTAAFFGRERSLAASENEMVLSVARQASQVLTRMRVQKQLAYAAQHDQLTGLVNRAAIRERIALALATAHQAAQPLSLMFLDLDGFKIVNDRLGHHVGDAILIEVAKRLAASVRASDIVGRYGGDEFVVLCTSAGRREAAAISSRIHAEIRNAFPDAAEFTIGASIGIATIEASGSVASIDALISAADAAMYESKRLGRGRTTQASL